MAPSSRVAQFPVLQWPPQSPDLSLIEQRSQVYIYMWNISNCVMLLSHYGPLRNMPIYASANKEGSESKRRSNLVLARCTFIK